MTIVLGIPTLNRFDLLIPCIESALSGSAPPDQVAVIDNSAGAYPPDWQARYEGRVVVHAAPHNYGVAASWNILRNYARSAGAQLIISNDDITFAPDTIALLLITARATPNAGIVSAIEGQRFSLFWLNPRLYANPDWAFDEQFQMAYFEDNDYAWRLTLAGWEQAVAPSDVRHVGSATLQAMTPEQMAQKHAAWRHNEAYYLKRWGGMPGHERFTEPQP